MDTREKISRSRLRAWALVLLLLAIWYAPGIAQQRQAVVKKDGAVVYAQPKSGAKVLGRLSKGTRVTVLRVSGKVAEIRYGGRKGYMKKSALSIEKVSATPAPAEQQHVVATKKTEQAAYVYRKASTSSAKKKIKAGTKVQILEDLGAWYRVKRGNAVGYIQKTAFEKPSATPTPALKSTPKSRATPAPAPASTAQAKATATPAPTGGKTMTLQKKASVYKAAKTTSAVLETLPAGTDVTVIRAGKKWVRIRRNGKIGYVQKSAFEKSSGATPTPAPSHTPTPRPAATPTPAPTAASLRDPDATRAAKVVAAALAQLGKPYVYGSSGTSSFDCSGLVGYAYRQVGVSLPHSAYSIGYGSRGTKIVSVSKLQKGDVICMNTISDGDLCDHVGIYIGAGQFVHASSGQRKVVVSSITSGYYAGVFSWAKRYL